MADGQSKPEVPLTIEDVCKLLNVQRSRLYKLIRTGLFPRPRKIAGKSLYLLCDWQAYLTLAGRWEPGPFTTEKEESGRAE